MEAGDIAGLPVALECAPVASATAPSIARGQIRIASAPSSRRTESGVLVRCKRDHRIGPWLVSECLSRCQVAIARRSGLTFDSSLSIAASFHSLYRRDGSSSP